MKINKNLDSMLLACGLRDNLAGTDYARRAIMMYEPGMSIGKDVYPAIAAACGTRSSCVERSIRHAIESGFQRCGYDDEVMTMFGNTINPDTGKPTNGEFVARLARLYREGLTGAN